LREIYEKFNTIDFACWLTETVKILPFTDSKKAEEEIDLQMIDLDSLSPAEMEKVMEMKMKADRMKEREKLMRENPEEFEKEAKRELENVQPVLKDVEDTIIGFGDAFLPVIFTFNLKTKTSSIKELPNTLRLKQGFLTHRLSTGDILLYQGEEKGSVAFDSLEIFSPKFWKSFTAPQRIKRVKDSTIVELKGDEKQLVYFIGGLKVSENFLVSNVCEVYDMRKKTWEVIASLKITRLGFTAFANDGDLFVIGGINNQGTIEDTIEKYDPVQNEWNIIEMRYVSTLYKGLAFPKKLEVLILGGMTKNHRLDHVYILRFFKQKKQDTCTFLKNVEYFKTCVQPRFHILGDKVWIESEEQEGKQKVWRAFDPETAQVGGKLDLDYESFFKYFRLNCIHIV
jgi:hypothetical protein